jgi:hypothetical protein
VSKDGGRSWDKPSLGLVEFDGSTDNNIVAGKQLNSSSVQESIEPGTVFIDTNPACPASEKWKMVITWQGGATMFASADGFNFKNMTASPALTGSDSQDVVFWDPRVGSAGAYVYYGRSHLKGGQNESCADSLGPGKIGSVSGPGRSVNHFVIGGDVTKWPVHSADTDAEKLTILNTDELDPPCIDIYTNVATPLGDAYFFWPMMYNHFDEIYSQGRGNDGLLEARMAVSRDGTNVSYITRDAWLTRGSGQPRLNHTGICETPLHRCIAAVPGGYRSADCAGLYVWGADEGAFDAAGTAVARGISQVGDETVLFGWGSQYTHGKYARPHAVAYNHECVCTGCLPFE